MSQAYLNYTIILEKTSSSYGAYVPDLPGCVAVGNSKEEAFQLIQEAIVFHLEGMQDDGQLIPEPVSTSEIVRVSLKQD